MPKEVVETVKTIKDVGEEQFRSFVSDRIETQKVPWTSTIHLNKLPLFSDKPKTSKQKSNVVALKQERSQVIHMMLSSQSGREINENAFSHENSAYPPSLSRNEEICCSTKSEIIKFNVWKTSYLLPLPQNPQQMLSFLMEHSLCRCSNLAMQRPFKNMQTIYSFLM
ncbi:hypothetical protein RRG08_015497 [Elysia crispata]|uniref:Uncharacterized protein n=1 Tax=Elysia crispata TaxID=231223 RepID=A0AAE1DWT3_9GAST|nr:hypothetical protein RRG08_015497 [Elysia crispata]